MNAMTDVANLRLPFGDAASQYQVEFDPEYGTLWGYFNPRGTPCFSLSLLSDIRAHDSVLALNRGKVLFEGAMHPANYYVVGSRVKGVFNLGGDLSLFQMLIKTRDRDALVDYGRRCIDCIFPHIQHHGSPAMTTIALVQGDALGGGFETVLANDVIVAEESSTMGLPEILFNLFPGMGAYSLLARRLGMKAAENMILSGRLYKAAELHEMGVVDVVAPDGDGERAVYDWIRRNHRRRNGIQAMFQSRQHVHPITREELDGVVDVWVDAALRLEEKDLRMMHRLVRAQTRRSGADAATDADDEQNLQPNRPRVAVAGA
ncbi:MAG: crotonase/enoyl-CoA hydratase family protein [Burkholderiales bacterium]|nr:crotonase/enoyl-CoA hydratase family protein [Burkholderiales bacterium]